MLRSLELCAGAGGQALGLEAAGFDHSAVVEIDKHCCATLRHNRPQWDVRETDLRLFKEEAHKFRGDVDLVAGGLPCPPFSVAGKQLGENDERNLFPDAIDIVDAIRPSAVMIENVRGFLDAVFEDYRTGLKENLEKLGYEVDWTRLISADYGVPQLRPRVVIVAIERKRFGGLSSFDWPKATVAKHKTVGEAIGDLMAERGWAGVDEWIKGANTVAPTLVGGSKKHGGADLGPTRAKRAWEQLGVDGKGVADEAPGHNFVGLPRLTIPMVARLQGFPAEWTFSGGKTAAYRQVGNAFPPPVAEAVASELRNVLQGRKQLQLSA